MSAERLQALWEIARERYFSDAEMIEFIERLRCSTVPKKSFEIMQGELRNELQIRPIERFLSGNLVNTITLIGILDSPGNR